MARLRLTSVAGPSDWDRASLTLPTPGWRLAHLAALWAFGVSQPVFSMLAANPEFLVVRGATRLEVVVFAIAVTVVPPLVVIGVELLVAVISPALSRALHIVAVWCFAFLAVLQLTRSLDLEQGAALLLPIVPAGLVAVAYMRWPSFRSFLSLAALLPLVGAAYFVWTVPLAVDDREGAHAVPRAETPVVLVVLDEFPTSSILRSDGRIDAGRYPSFARLSRDGTWYPRATTVHEHSTQAIPAILTGRQPRDGQLPTLADHPENLFTLLGESYRFRVRELVTRLCPVRYCPERRERRPLADRFRGLTYDAGIAYLHRVLPPSLRGDLPAIGDRWGGFGDEANANARDRLLGALDERDVDAAVAHKEERPRVELTRFTRSIRSQDPPRTLYFLHLLMPHAPWRYLPSGREYGNTALVGGTRDGWNRWDDSAALVQHGLERHLLQVGYADRLVGQVLDRLERERLYDRSLVIVMADHGVSFEPGGSRRLVDSRNFADIAAVPLFVKYPFQRRGRTDDRDAMTIDVFPTIADVLGIRLPWHVDGRSLRAVGGRRAVVSVSRRKGGRVESTREAVASGVLRTARRNERLFGQGESILRFGRRGRPGLLGEATSRLTISLPARETAELVGESLLANVDTAAAFMPLHVVGHVEGGLPVDLAIEVNGRIAAVTRTFAVDGRQRFAALVPEAAFRDGANDIDVYALVTRRPVRLVRIGGTADRPRYVLRPAERSIVGADGRTLSVEPGRLQGRIDSWVEDGRTVRIGGWAADTRELKLPDRVLLFAGTRLVFDGPTDLLRWDLAETGGYRGLERSGWVAELPANAVRREGLRAFAVRGEVASELGWAVP